MDLEAFPRTWRLPVSRWFAWVMLAMAALGAERLVSGAVGVVDWAGVAVGGAQLALGVVGATVTRRARVVLEPLGYRVGDPALRGRLRPWSGVLEVRPPGRWTEHAEIRGTRAADGPVALADMSAEQAAELQRRLVEARSAAGVRSDP